MDSLNQQPIQTPMTPPSMTPMSQKEGRPIGPIIATLLIVILLVVAAVYVWGQKLNNDNSKKIVTPPATTPITQTTQTAPKDDLTDLEANLDSSLKNLEDMNF